VARLVGVVGSRSLPASFAPLVSSLVSLLVGRGFGVASGGASGADAFALSALLGQGACPEQRRGAAARSALFRHRRSGRLGLGLARLVPPCRRFRFVCPLSRSRFCLLLFGCFPSRPLSGHALHRAPRRLPRSSGPRLPLRRRCLSSSRSCLPLLRFYFVVFCLRFGFVL